MTPRASSLDESPWRYSDAWILAAIGYGCRHDELSGLIGAADHYNHAIPAAGEVSQAIGRLVASEVISIRGRRLVPTEAGKTIWRRSKGDGYQRIVSLQAALSAVPMVEGAWELPADALERGYHRYAHPLTWRWRAPLR